MVTAGDDTQALFLSAPAHERRILHLLTLERVLNDQRLKHAISPCSSCTEDRGQLIENMILRMANILLNNFVKRQNRKMDEKEKSKRTVTAVKHDSKKGRRN
eukprot:Colp12_sorted_trinity150504_noHs@12568